MSVIYSDQNESGTRVKNKIKAKKNVKAKSSSQQTVPREAAFVEEGDVLTTNQGLRISDKQDIEVPQAQTAHDTFWDFISLMPGTRQQFWRNRTVYFDNTFTQLRRSYYFR